MFNLLIFVVVFSIIPILQAENRVPSLSDISNINDPVLNEVFASSKSNIPREDDEPIPMIDTQPTSIQTSQQTVRPTASTFRYTHPQGEIPITRPDSLGSSIPPSTPDSFSQLVTTGANVFATGANAFYRGAASVGQAIGINDYNYQIPLVNQAAALFG